MAVSKEDLRDFARFADEKLSRGGADSLIELVGQWEAHRHDKDDAIADVRQSHADIDAGRVSPVADAFEAVRKQLGLR